MKQRIRMMDVTFKRTAILSWLGLLIFTGSAAQILPMLDSAVKYKALFPKDEMCARLSEDRFSFELSMDNDRVKVIQDFSEEYVAFRDNLETAIYENYNAFSYVKDIRMSVRNGGRYKEEKFDTYIKPYHESDIFDNDVHIVDMRLKAKVMGTEKKLTYTKQYDDIKYISSAYFHCEYPVAMKKIVFEIPDWLDVELKEMNFEGYGIVKTVVKHDKSTMYTYTLEHCGAHNKEEAHAPAASFNFPHILLLPKYFTADNKKLPIIGTLDNLYAWYASVVNTGGTNKDTIKPLVNEILKGISDERSKISTLFYWIQDNIRYIAFESGMEGYRPMDADQVLQKKYGDCKGIANLLTNMLQIAGFDARLTWIGTKDIPYDYSLPCLATDNHMICTLFYKDSVFYLDGTEDFVALGDYAHRIQGRQVLIQDGKGYLLKTVPDLPKERNKMEELKTIELHGDALHAHVRTTYQGESQTSLLSAYHGLETQDRGKAIRWFMSGGDKNMNILQSAPVDFTVRGKPIVFDYQCDMSNRVTSAGNEMYISIDWSDDLNEYLPVEGRKSDIIFNEKICRAYTTELEIPAGYVLESLPTPLKIDQDGYHIDVHYQQTGQKIVLTKNIGFDIWRIKLDQMAQWKSVVRQMKEMNANLVVLKKI